MQASLPPPSPSTRPEHGPVPQVTPPADGRGRLLRWGPPAVAVVLGLGSVFLLNQLRPPRSLRQSLLRYAIAQVPVMLSVASHYALGRAAEGRAAEGRAAGGRAAEGHAADSLVPDDRPDTNQFRQISAFHIDSQRERTRRRHLGIPTNHPNLPSLYIAAWLNGTASTRFNSLSVLVADLYTGSPDSVAGLVTACRQFQWHSVPLPGSRTCHTHEGSDRALARSPHVEFHVLRCPPHEPDGPGPLPLQQLQCGDVLLLMVVVAVEDKRQEGRMFSALQCCEDGIFLLFNPDKGLFVTAGQQLVQDTVSQDIARQQGSHLELIRLRRRPWR